MKMTLTDLEECFAQFKMIIKRQIKLKMKTHVKISTRATNTMFWFVILSIWLWKMQATIEKEPIFTLPSWLAFYTTYYFMYFI